MAGARATAGAGAGAGAKSRDWGIGPWSGLSVGGGLDVRLDSHLAGGVL